MKASKFGNRKVKLDGFTFDSEMEAGRYLFLLGEQKAGRILALTVHKNIRITFEGRTICFYEADFTYIKNGRRVVEDVKGFKTDVYKLKKKMLEILMGIEIKEITR